MKWYGVLRVRFVRYTEDGEEITTEGFFHSTTVRAMSEEILEDQMAQMEQEMLAAMEEFQREGSGWVLDAVLGLEIFLVRYIPLRGSTYIPTPRFIEKEKCTINIPNYRDQKCFLWAVLAGLHPGRPNPNRISHYRELEHTLDMEGISYPVEIRQIPVFEVLNDVSVSVFGFEDSKDGVFPVHITSRVRERHVDLLLLSDEEGTSHYVTICSLSRLLRKAGDTYTKHFCSYCLHGFRTADARNRHTETCSLLGPQRVDFPGDGEKTLKFKNFKAIMPVPFVIYADLESFVVPVQGCEPNPRSAFSWETHSHVPSGYCYQVVCQDPTRTKEAVVYRGPDVMEHMLDAMIKEAEEIQGQLQDPAPMIFGPEENTAFRRAVKCFVCGEDLGTDRVRDHDHLTGRYRGAAHSACNLQLQVRRGKNGCALQVPVVFHNLKGYDANHIMSVIGKYEARFKVSCIAQTMEKYLTFSLGNLKFIDSLQFMSASLETLVGNLSKAPRGDQKFTQLNKHFPPDQADLLRRKGVFPYSYITGPEVLEERRLPSKRHFFNDLAQEHISPEDYAHAQKVWDTFRMQTLGDYHDLYLKTDVLLLADVFENFRKLCQDIYQLDPAHYISAPGLSWDSMLKTTGVQLELITDPDMHLFLERGMRGGVSMISTREAKANNPYIPETYEPELDKSYIAYWDANNLYGWSMSKPLPHRDFHWLAPEEVEELDPSHIDVEADVGYILEVDLDYPQHLHEKHNDYPLAPETKVVTGGMLSPYSLQVGTSIYGHRNNIPSSKKLVPHLGPRRNYVTHAANLKLYLQQGMVLKKIHKVLAFYQSAWMKPYIDMNTERRKYAASTFEKDFFKLMNNSSFGKTCENVRNRHNVELVINDGRLTHLTARPSFRRFKIFGEHLVAVELLKPSVKLNKPIYAGVTTLEVSKTLMYDFHYNVIKARYMDKARLLFTDTDSLCYHIQTEDLYEDMKDMGEDLFDTSNYPRDHPLHSRIHEKEIGKMKDELAGVPGQEFVGLRAKMYSLLVKGGEQKNTAKGVDRKLIRKQLKHDLYREVLNKGSKIMARSFCIRPNLLRLATRFIQKVGLSAYDDKRYVEATGFTYAHGHYLAEEELEKLRRQEAKEIQDDINSENMTPPVSSDEEDYDEEEGYV